MKPSTGPRSASATDALSDLAPHELAATTGGQSRERPAGRISDPPTEPGEPRGRRRGGAGR